MGKNFVSLRWLILHRGQILIEGLIFMIFILSFLLMVHLFQSLVRKEIQKQRLTLERKPIKSLQYERDKNEVILFNGA